MIPFQKPIIVRPEVDEYEVEHRLPALYGSPRQVSYARITRYQFLYEIGTEWFDKAMERPNHAQVIEAFDRLKQCDQSKRWIEEVRPYLGKSIEMILDLPEIEAAIAKKNADEAAEKAKVVAERRRKAAEGRKDIAAAKAWETVYDLPPLTGVSSKQISFGRRCRYQMLRSGLSVKRIAAMNPNGNILTAEFWIDVYQNTGGIWSDPAGQMLLDRARELFPQNE